MEHLSSEAQIIRKCRIQWKQLHLGHQEVQDQVEHQDQREVVEHQDLAEVQDQVEHQDLVEVLACQV
jgi:hypothetical protein